MKVEGTYGTDVFAGTYTAADIMPCFNIAPAPTLEEIENLALSGDIGRLPSGIGRELAGVTFEAFVRGAGVAYSASVKPELDRALQACGLSSTFSGTAGSEIVTYQPTAAPSSYTIYVVQENGSTLKMAGCFGDVDFTMRAGGIISARFSFQGLLVDEADVAFVGGAIAGTPPYPTVKSAGFQIDTGNYAPRIGTVGFRMGNVLQAVPSINAAGGVAGFFIADRRPLLTIDPESAPVATFAWFTKHKAGTLMDCDFTVGGVQYNKMRPKFNAALAAGLQIVQRSWGSRDGLTAFPTTLLATISAGNDDFSIVFS
jgi:hypothetical protein